MGKRLLLVLAAFLTVTSCSSGSVDPSQDSGSSDCCANDPRDGDVFLRGPLHKTCDDDRLIYWSVEGGVATVENSRQCQPR